MGQSSPPPSCIKYFVQYFSHQPPAPKGKSACPKGKILLVNFWRWDLWGVYTSTCSPLSHILVMQFLEARALVFLPWTCSGCILQNAEQLANPKQLWNLVIWVMKLSDSSSRLVHPVYYSYCRSFKLIHIFCFLTLITKLWSHLALSSPSVLWKYPCDQYMCIKKYP